VLAKIQRRAGGGFGAQRAEGRIIRILDRAHPSIVGLFRYGPHGNTVLPYDVESSTRWKYTRPGMNQVFGRNWDSRPDETASWEDASRAWTSLMGAVVNVELVDIRAEVHPPRAASLKSSAVRVNSR